MLMEFSLITIRLALSSNVFKKKEAELLFNLTRYEKLCSHLRFLYAYVYRPCSLLVFYWVLMREPYKNVAGHYRLF
jgi:hypothetical protein